MNEYGSDLHTLCSTMPGADSDLPASTRDLPSRANLENVLDISAMIAGGAVLATGITLVILNRPRAVIRDEHPPAPSGPQLVPTISSHSVGATLLGRF